MKDSSGKAECVDVLWILDYYHRGCLRNVVQHKEGEGSEMEIEYKGFSVITGADRDGSTDLWNGRYRILDEKGVVIYESFVDPQSEQEAAEEAAKQKAHEWIDAR
jgi:hypothetical protein